MKIYHFKSFIIVLFLSNLLNLGLYAQDKLDNANSVIHSRKHFLNLENTRLSNLMKAISNQQELESMIVSRLNKKNDSLLSLGNIYDSVSAEIAEQLNKEKYRVDSISKRLTSINQKLDPFNKFKKEYSSISYAVNTLTETVLNKKAIHELLYSQIEVRMDTSNLDGEKKILKGILNSAASQQEKEKVIIGQIDDVKISQTNSGNIAGEVALKIDNRLQAYQKRMDSIGAEIELLGAKINSPKEFTKDFKLIKTRVFLIDSIVNKSAAVREYVFRMLDEGLAKSMKNLFELAAFFGPGGFIIPKSKYNVARSYFLPIVDSLVKFSNKYETVQRTSSILVNGYADATSIKKGSRLYKILAEYLRKEDPQKEELNAALSALRAEEISKFLNVLLKEKFPDFKTITKIVFESVEAGLGEKLPDPKILDYRENDERRRVVIIYWNVLPNK